MDNKRQPATFCVVEIFMVLLYKLLTEVLQNDYGVKTSIFKRFLVVLCG
jgi:hypothetical protein